MTTIVTKAGKGSKLTHAEVDANWNNLNNDKLEKDGSIAMTGALNVGGNAISNVGNVDGRDISSDGSKLDGIESGATADQTDSEIEAAYNTQVAAASQSEAEAGTGTAIRRFSPLRIFQAITSRLQQNIDMAGAILQGHGLLVVTISASGNLNNSHRAAYVRSTAGSPLTITIQPESSFAYSSGFQCVIFQAASGTVTIQAGAGVILNGVTAGATTISEQRQSVALVRNGSDNWDISGAREDVA